MYEKCGRTIYSVFQWFDDEGWYFVDQVYGETAADARRVASQEWGDLEVEVIEASHVADNAAMYAAFLARWQYVGLLEAAPEGADHDD